MHEYQIQCICENSRKNIRLGTGVGAKQKLDSVTRGGVVKANRRLDISVLAQAVQRNGSFKPAGNNGESFGARRFAADSHCNEEVSVRQMNGRICVVGSYIL